jgi:transcription elongation factor Elf1
MGTKIKEKIARYCPKCGVINWVSISVQTTRLPITCGSCKVKTGFWEWGLYSKTNMRGMRRSKSAGWTASEQLKARVKFEAEQKKLADKYKDFPLLNAAKPDRLDQKARKLTQTVTSGIWLHCPHCASMQFKESDYDKDWLRCTKCTFIRKLELWLTVAEWKADIKAKETPAGSAQRLLYCPACNEKKWVSTHLFKDKDLLTCIQCKRKLPMKAFRMTENPNVKKYVKKPKKKLEILVTQRYTNLVKEVKLKFKIDAEHKGDIKILEKHDLMLVLIILDTSEVMLQILHKDHQDLVIELRVCENDIDKANKEVEDMLTKMFTGKELKKFIAKRLKYILARQEKRLVKT